MLSKAELKVLFADSIYANSRADGPSYVSVLCYYFIDREQPVKPAIELFRHAHAKVTMFPNSLTLPGFSNHVLALRIPGSYDFSDVDSILFCLEGVKAALDTFPTLVLCGLFVKGYFLHLNHVGLFFERFQDWVGSAPFRRTTSVIIYYYYYVMFKLNMIRILLLFVYFTNSYYWNTLVA